MDENSFKKLKRKVFLIFPLSFIIMATMLVWPAGSLGYWQGWVFCAVILTPALFTALYFLKRALEFLERRMKYKEKESQQKNIIAVSNLFCLLGFLIPGFDFRYGWSSVPIWLVILSDIIILAGYFLIFFSFKENVYAGRTVEIFKGQKVIDSGPYAIVRHPMYAGIIPLFLFIPLALGSFWGIIPMLVVCAAIIFRIFNEEEMLKRDLPGYVEYCEKVRYRLIPFIW